MTEFFEIKTRAHKYSAFIGVPVLIQLKIPLLMLQVAEAQALPHTTLKTRQWVPTEARDTDAKPGSEAYIQAPLSSTEFIKYATIDGYWGNALEISWLAPSVIGPVVVSSIIAESEIAAISRLPDPPPLPEPPKLVTL